MYKSGLPVVEYNPSRGRNILKTFAYLDRDHRKYWIFNEDDSDFNITQNSDSELKMWLFNQDTDSKRSISNMIHGFITYARREIWIIQPYTVTNRQLLSRVKYMSERGVQVNIIISVQHGPHLRFQYASFYGIKLFETALYLF